MHVLPISNTNIRTQQKRSNGVKKATFAKEDVSFKGYRELIQKYALEKFETRKALDDAFYDMVGALKKEGHIPRPDVYSVLKDYSYDRNYSMCLTYFGVPITKLSPKVRNVVMDARDNPIPILEIDKDTKMEINNEGQYGILSHFFNSCDAKNRIEFIFSAPSCEMVFGFMSDGSLGMNQEFGDYYARSIYEGSKLRKHYDGDMRDAIAPIF